MDKPTRRAFKKREPNQILRVVKPFRDFMRLESSSSFILLAFIAAAMVIANTPLAHYYFEFWETPISLTVGSFTLEFDLHHLINDLLMTLFFLLIGLEIKREIIIGELCQLSRALLPIIAAIGGMLVPALTFLMFNPLGTTTAQGWAIPMATDIAVALGVMALFGRELPTSLKIFMTTLAIFDDIAGVVVIALFYTGALDMLALLLALGCLTLLLAASQLGIRSGVVYAVGGVTLWFFVFISGLHPTMAGILLAAAIPSTISIGYSEFAKLSGELAKKIDRIVEDEESPDIHSFLNTSQTLEDACKNVEPPLQRLEHTLTPWIAFAIVPLFALANGGVALDPTVVSQLWSPLCIGLIVGFFLGKPIGILLATYLAVRLGICQMPADVGWDMLMGAGFLAGIGFTIATFISGLAFGAGPFLPVAKTSILIGSGVAGTTGYLILRRSIRVRRKLSKGYAANASMFEANEPTATGQT
jgi:NhaA family Na+:H+ antiporter